MTELLRSIDDFVFDAPKVGVQALANKAQYYFDVTPMAVARFFLGLHCVVMFAIVMVLYHFVPYKAFLVLCVLVAMSATLAWRQYVRTFTYEKMLEKTGRNVLRSIESFFFVRMVQLAVIAVLLVSLSHWWVVMPVSIPFTCYLYFSAADQLPPSDRYQWRKPVTEGV